MLKIHPESLECIATYAGAIRGGNVNQLYYEALPFIFVAQIARLRRSRGFLRCKIRKAETLENQQIAVDH